MTCWAMERIASIKKFSSFFGAVFAQELNLRKKHRSCCLFRCSEHLSCWLKEFWKKLENRDTFILLASVNILLVLRERITEIQIQSRCRFHPRQLSNSVISLISPLQKQSTIRTPYRASISINKQQRRFAATNPLWLYRDIKVEDE